MPSNTRNLLSATSYADCERLFAKPEVKSRKWLPNERPLGSSSQHHYRVEKHGDTFKVMLYWTTMAEYSKLPDGGMCIKYQWDNRPTSTAFMWNAVHVGHILQYATTDGKKVLVPLADAGSATLVFDKDRLLNVHASDHGDVYTYRSNAGDKAKRVEAKQRLQVYLDAALTCAYAAGLPDAAMCAPFSAPNTPLPRYVCLALYDGAAQQPDVQEFMRYAAAAWKWLHGRAAYDKKAPPTIEQLEKHLQRKYLRVLGLDKGADRVARPKFPVCL